MTDKHIYYTEQGECFDCRKKIAITIKRGEEHIYAIDFFTGCKLALCSECQEDSTDAHSER